MNNVYENIFDNTVKDIKTFYFDINSVQKNKSIDEISENILNLQQRLKMDFENLSKIKNNDFLLNSQIDLLKQKIETLLIYINLELKTNKNISELKENIRTVIQKEIPSILTRISNIRENVINQNLQKKFFSIEKEDESFFLRDIYINLILNPIYNIYIDKSTGELFLSKDLNLSKEQLEEKELIKKEISGDSMDNEYDFMKNYVYTSSLHELAVSFNKELEKNNFLSRDSINRFYCNKNLEENSEKEYLDKEKEPF